MLLFDVSGHNCLDLARDVCDPIVFVERSDERRDRERRRSCDVESRLGQTSRKIVKVTHIRDLKAKLHTFVVSNSHRRVLNKSDVQRRMNSVNFTGA